MDGSSFGDNLAKGLKLWAWMTVGLALLVLALVGTVIYLLVKG